MPSGQRDRVISSAVAAQHCGDGGEVTPSLEVLIRQFTVERHIDSFSAKRWAYSDMPSFRAIAQGPALRRTSTTVVRPLHADYQRQYELCDTLLRL